MRPQKVLDTEIFNGLFTVLRSKGYDGASLNELAGATGLKKASLYHRFPGGKQEMAAAVLTHLDQWVEQHIFKVLSDKTKTPKERLINGITGIRELYDGGSESCIFRALSMESGIELFHKQIGDGMQKWIDTFKTVGISYHLTPKIAEEKAIETLIKIQGSLVVAKGLNDLTVFENTLQQIEDYYLKI